MGGAMKAVKTCKEMRKGMKTKNGRNRHKRTPETESSSEDDYDIGAVVVAPSTLPTFPRAPTPPEDDAVLDIAETSSTCSSDYGWGWGCDDVLGDADIMHCNPWTSAYDDFMDHVPTDADIDAAGAALDDAYDDVHDDTYDDAVVAPSRGTAKKPASPSMVAKVKRKARKARHARMHGALIPEDIDE
jgi:hypothetical protein